MQDVMYSSGVLVKYETEVPADAHQSIAVLELRFIRAFPARHENQLVHAVDNPKLFLSSFFCWSLNARQHVF